MRSLLAWSLLGILVGAAALPGQGASRQAPPPDFNRDVRPVLSRHCFKCHGPDDKQRQGGLRLDVRSVAVQTRAIVPGKPDQSELLKRVHSADESLVMPPPATKNPLTTAEKEVLRRWVSAGAEYRAHWAFVAPRASPFPAVKQKSWPKNPIDHFVLARLEKEGLKPSPPADRYSLVRRLYFDLLGVPPTPEEADQFLHDTRANAYEALVDRLLASPRYGERWARKWLDLARYADTNGYEKDRPRSIWPYRDWVINALNRDMPFDRFTIAQLAGDLLPNATVEDRVATGFHRNTMLNEEGGIDPLEFRFHAMTDRVGTTATTWLGLTLACAQCHTHKFDPIPHREYYQFMAFLNNADEPELEVPVPDLVSRRSEIDKQIAAREADLANRFPPAGEMQWETVIPTSAESASGAALTTSATGATLVSGVNPDKDLYTLVGESGLTDVEAIRLEALTDPALGGKGPGRTPHGNFVLSEFSAAVVPNGEAIAIPSVRIAGAVADYSQDTFPAGNAVDGKATTGWAIHGPEPWNVNRTITFRLEKPLTLPAGARWTFKLDQQHGSQHTLGKFRISLGRRLNDGRPLEVRSREHLERKFAEWQATTRKSAARWTVLKPVSAKSNLPLLTILEDASVFASGDQSKRDIYDLAFKPELKGITAVRIEVMTDERLPRRGPGRIYYEGPIGDFFLSEVTLAADGKKVPLSGASHSFASGGNTTQAALDGDPQTGWSINGAQGQSQTAVFNLAQPLASAEKLDLSLLFERYYAAGMGRLRISVTGDPAPKAVLPPDVEAIVVLAPEMRTAAQSQRLLAHYLSVAPELAAERAEIARLRAQMPALPTTLVFEERPANNPRATHVHNRGEFLQPRERVEPGVLSFLPPLPKAAPKNRLTFARWLVDPRNPLVGRVTVNRHWAALFGKGIVRTTEDFGFQGESPTHPELLDYLATVFTAAPGSPTPTRPHAHTPTPGLGWSVKALHKLIVTSATYRQSSRVTPELLAKDPQNKLLARAPRVRLDAELVRDTALQISGLLSSKLGGPSVFPPQPANVTSEGTYGQLSWTVSQGEDRHRRGLYTFAKRTAPYAMFTTFDGPSGEACVARREVSNTPLQALTLLNDAVFIETAQALGKMVAARPGSASERATYLFRRCLTRPPSSDELKLVTDYYELQRERLQKKELDPVVIAGVGDGDPVERAAWTLSARTLLNVDEAIVKP